MSNWLLVWRYTSKDSAVKYSHVYVTRVFTSAQRTRTRARTHLYSPPFSRASPVSIVYGGKEIASLSHVCPQIMQQCSCGSTIPSSLPRLPAFVLSLCSFAAGCCWKPWWDPTLLINPSIAMLVRGVIWGKGKCPFTAPTFSSPHYPNLSPWEDLQKVCS